MQDRKAGMRAVLLHLTSHFKGFIMTSWEYSDSPGKQRFIRRGIDIFAEALAAGC